MINLHVEFAQAQNGSNLFRNAVDVRQPLKSVPIFVFNPQIVYDPSQVNEMLDL